jgi:uncharacterized FlaG/YvyC family protein
VSRQKAAAAAAAASRNENQGKRQEVVITISTPAKKTGRHQKRQSNKNKVAKRLEGVNRENKAAGAPLRFRIDTWRRCVCTELQWHRHAD